jgi:hypothetical protein
MKTGFLTLITHPEHPELVRAQIRDELPELKSQQDGGEVRYVARFRDGEAALMHVQNVMHSHLENLENRIYRRPLEQMIACVEADGLEHERVWIDPALDDEKLRQLDRDIKKRKSSRKRGEQAWQIVGYLALLLLILISLRL